MTINIVQVICPEDCYAHTCDCKPGECHFERCEDCGVILNPDGSPRNEGPNDCPECKEQEELRLITWGPMAL